MNIGAAVRERSGSRRLDVRGKEWAMKQVLSMLALSVALTAFCGRPTSVHAASHPDRRAPERIAAKAATMNTGMFHMSAALFGMSGARVLPSVISLGAA